MPGAVRGRLRARHLRAARHHQEHRVRHHRQRVRERLDDARGQLTTPWAVKD